MTRRELLAVVIAVTDFCPRLYSQKFKWRALVLQADRTVPPRREIVEFLAEFNFSLKHRDRTKLKKADGLNRSTDCKQCECIANRYGGPLELTGVRPPASDGYFSGSDSLHCGDRTDTTDTRVATGTGQRDSIDRG